MRPYHLGLEREVLDFYTDGFRTTAATRESFGTIGEQATQQVITEILPSMSALQRGPEIILVGGIARAGVGMCPRKVVRLWEESFPQTPVWVFSLGASRPRHPDRDPAEIYWEGNFGRLPRRDYSNCVLVSYEFGLATASTAAAVFPLWRRVLPGLRDENIIFIAGCACLEQSAGRLARVSQEAILAYGSEWRYTHEEGQRFYLKWMRGRDGRWAKLEPRDWGSCCFGEGATQFIPLLEQTVKLTGADRQAIRAHFAGGESSSHL